VCLIDCSRGSIAGWQITDIACQVVPRRASYRLLTPSLFTCCLWFYRRVHEHRLELVKVMAGLGALFVAAMFSAACSPGQSSRAPSLSTGSSSASSRSGSAVVTPVPSPTPVAACSGLTVDTAEELVAGGEGVALVEASVTEQPGDEANHTRIQPIASYKLLAGALSTGPLQTLEVAESGSVNFLPPATYVLLVGQSSGSSAYFLSDGVSGVFTLADDGGVAELCLGPNGKVAPVQSGTERHLISVMGSAFRQIKAPQLH